MCGAADYRASQCPIAYHNQNPAAPGPSTPVKLLGRDILAATKAVIMCGPMGLTVTVLDGQSVDLPGPMGLTVTVLDGQSVDCNHRVSGHGQWLLNNVPKQHQSAGIYWTWIEPEPASCQKSVLSLFQLWKLWICSLRPYHPSIEPLHCTLFFIENKMRSIERSLG